MRKIQIMTAVFFAVLCMTACGSPGKDVSSNATEGEKESAQEESAQTETTQKGSETPERTSITRSMREKTTEAIKGQDKKMGKPEVTEEREVTGYQKIPVLTGGGMPFTNMTVVYAENYPNGSYYYEDRTEDGYTSIINCSYLSMREDEEKPEDYAVRAAVGQSLYEVRETAVRKDERYSQNLGYPVYIVTFTAGRNEDTRFWTVFVTEAYGYTYLYAFDIWADAADGMEEIIEDIFGRLELIDAEPVEDWWEPDKGAGMDGAGVWTLQEVRSLAEANGDICSAILLGYSTNIASFLAEMDLTDYPFISEIPKENYVELPDGGTEIYCIIPTDPSASLAVNEWVMDETNGFYGETGQVLYRSESGDPILLRANPSDVVPSTQVVIVNSAGESLDWNPSISLYDGKMQTPWYSPGVTDITDYESEPFFGWWSVTLPDSNELTMILNFQRMGNHMSYSYGYGNSDLIAFYTGTWSVDSEKQGDGEKQYVTFSMRNVDNSSDTFWGVYTLELIDETLLEVEYVDGQFLCDGVEQSEYRFEWDSY